MERMIARNVVRVHWGRVGLNVLAKRNISNVHSPNELDLRVGRIREVALHENADTLYVSQVEVSDNGETVQVCSGLRGIVPASALEGRRVVLVSNLKPSKMRGVKSEAMLLCAAKKEEGTEKLLVEPVTPYNECNLGERLTFPTAENVDVPKRLKSAVWAEIAARLRVDGEGHVVWQGDAEHALDKCTVAQEYAGAEVS